MSVLADLETLSIELEDDSQMWSNRSLDDESSHQLLTSKIMAIAVLIGLGFISTAAIVSRVESPSVMFGVESLVE